MAQLDYTCHPRLIWPENNPRTRQQDRKNTAFRVKSPSDGAYRIVAELEALTKTGQNWRTTQVEICANQVVGRGGHFLADRQPAGADPGAALYFYLDGKPIVLACDAWSTTAGNLAAIAAHLEALRGISRWKVGTEEQLFSGYAALPEDTAWRRILDLSPTSSLADAEAAYRKLAPKAHPDKDGGSNEQMIALNNAIAHARKELN